MRAALYDTRLTLRDVCTQLAADDDAQQQGGEGDGEAAEKQAAAKAETKAKVDDDDDDNADRFHKRTPFQSLKILGWDLKKVAVQDDAKQKTVKIVEGHLQKAHEVDIKKVPLKPDNKVMRDDGRYQKVRIITYNAVKAAKTVSVDKVTPGGIGDEQMKARVLAATGARKQLAKKTLKTKVEEIADDAAKKPEGDGEERRALLRLPSNCSAGMSGDEIFSRFAHLHARRRVNTRTCAPRACAAATRWIRVDC